MKQIMINGRWTLLLPEHRERQWATPWEVERIESMHARLKSGMVVYDIGAEEGDMPALWASWGCRVAMVEPSPRVWGNIKAIWQANQLESPLLAFCGFAADDDYTPPGRHGQLALWPTSSRGPVIADHNFCVYSERPDMPRVRIDSIATEIAPPDAISVDVEGAELAVMRGAAEVLRTHAPDVWISIHPAFMRDTFGEEAAELHEFMADHGYTGTHLATDHEEHWLFTVQK